MQKTRRRPPGRPRHDANEAPVAETIMRTATRLFTELGYEGVSVEQVAELCGVTKATVYYHYDNKASLFTQSLVDLMNRIRQHTENALHDEGPLRDRLIRLAELRLTVPYAVHDFDALLVEATGVLTDRQLNVLREAEARVVQTVANAFRQAFASREIAAIDADVAAHSFLALLMVGKVQELDGCKLFGSPLEAATILVDMLWQGIAPKTVSQTV